MQDGAPCHQAKVVSRWLEEEGVDLIMKGRLQRDPPQIDKLSRMSVTELDQPMLEILARSMPMSILGFLAAKGVHTKF